MREIEAPCPAPDDATPQAPARSALLAAALAELARRVDDAPRAHDRFDLLMELESLLLEIEALAELRPRLPAARRAVMLAPTHPPNRGADANVVAAYVHAVAMGEPMPTLVALALAARHRELLWLLAESDPSREERGLRAYTTPVRATTA